MRWKDKKGRGNECTEAFDYKWPLNFILRGNGWTLVKGKKGTVSCLASSQGSGGECSFLSYGYGERFSSVISGGLNCTGKYSRVLLNHCEATVRVTRPEEP